MPGRGSKRTALIQVKMVAFAPIPKARVITTVRVKPGRFLSIRKLCRKSCQKISIGFLVSPLSAGCRHTGPAASIGSLASRTTQRATSYGGGHCDGFGGYHSEQHH